MELQSIPKDGAASEIIPETNVGVQKLSGWGSAIKKAVTKKAASKKQVAKKGTVKKTASKKATKAS